ncbi:hypothetical protein GCM10025875_06640 [Litorihabitans aurantiacus]|uniref:Uncharacterized protein n=1 Tax=Litorihabitans aurantiacus TaxID=1930061 RepID=A0AA37UUA7_9MICO|nr:hypothetical protein GCM10025875_06640 [Litorihabitans aurantiacus]
MCGSTWGFSTGFSAAGAAGFFAVAAGAGLVAGVGAAVGAGATFSGDDSFSAGVAAGRASPASAAKKACHFSSTEVGSALHASRSSSMSHSFAPKSAAAEVGESVDTLAHSIAVVRPSRLPG